MTQWRCRKLRSKTPKTLKRFFSYFLSAFQIFISPAYFYIFSSFNLENEDNSLSYKQTDMKISIFALKYFITDQFWKTRNEIPTNCTLRLFSYVLSMFESMNQNNRLNCLEEIVLWICAKKIHLFTKYQKLKKKLKQECLGISYYIFKYNWGWIKETTTNWKNPLRFKTNIIVSFYI